MQVMSAENYPEAMSTPTRLSAGRRRLALAVVFALSVTAVWLSQSYVLPQRSWLHWLIVWLTWAVLAYVLHPWIPGLPQRRRERRRQAEAAAGRLER